MTSNPPTKPGLLQPLRAPIFRRVWSASLPSNFAQQGLIVVAAWSMTVLHGGPGLVSLVQSAAALPIMLFALPAGAIADVFDRRKVAIAALCISILGAVLLFGGEISGLAAPPLLLVSCFALGTGFALFSPAWQASVGEQVGREALPMAITLYGVSANLARSAGPALGGALIAYAGTSAAAGVMALCYIPMLVALLSWRSPPAKEKPRSRILPVIVDGIAYVLRTPPVRNIMFRCLTTAFGATSVLALAPLIAKDLLQMGPSGLGMLLGSFGVGGFCAVFLLGGINRRIGPQRLLLLCPMAIGLAILGIAQSRLPILSCFFLLVCGMGWMVSMSLLNVAVQTTAPAHITGRALSVFQATGGLGIAAGSSAWGLLVTKVGLSHALQCAGLFLIVAFFTNFMAPIPTQNEIVT